MLPALGGAVAFEDLQEHRWLQGAGCLSYNSWCCRAVILVQLLKLSHVQGWGSQME